MKYRPDIDGIRALAVLLVILFHYQVPGVHGGYIGVDVFFVLSGYLISAIVFGQLREKRFSLGNFFFRRVRRLYPAYIAMMIVTLVGAFFWLLPADLRDFGESLFASTVYVSNVHFWLEAGYFDTESLLKPLLHTWSLSAEEQFYLIFPFVAWATASLKQNHLRALFGTLTALSLAAAALTIESDMSAVFYLYPFRAWEMFLGTLLALGVVSPVQRASVSMFLSVTGLFMIIGPACLYDEGTVFPGLNAFIPCLGTALLLHAGGTQSVAERRASDGEAGASRLAVAEGDENRGQPRERKTQLMKSPVQRVLSSRVLVYLGKISYSLYLWHWPIYILYTY